MHDTNAEAASRPTILDREEANRRKAALARLQDELADLGVESVLVGRHVLRLSGPGPWQPSGPADPELHVLATNWRCTVTTDGERYQLINGAKHPADDPAGAARHLLDVGTRRDYSGSPVPALLVAHQPAREVRAIGAGERALRQLRDDGVI
jgi:hypothetical protein